MTEVKDTTTEPVGGLPSNAEMQEAFRNVEDHSQHIFLWQYERSRSQLVTLYNRAATSQWSSERDLDWSTPVDVEGLVDENTPAARLYREAANVPGSPIASWGDKEFIELGIEMMKATLSQFMHGEQGAMMTAAKIVETVPWIDARYYAATQ
ncbi:MAG TPA: hypothetical protein VN793_08695, partial [Acidimicrobiales bacterium]|nr:hypothetical protein [Acidimicrobiales bacterium]